MEPTAGTIHWTQKSQLAWSLALGENAILFNSAKWTECQTAFQILTVIAVISVAFHFNAHQRSLPLIEVNTETHNYSKCRDSDCGELNSHILLPTNLSMGEGKGNTVGVKGQGGLLGIILSRHDKAVVPMNSEQLWLLACIRTAQD